MIIQTCNGKQWDGDSWTTKTSLESFMSLRGHAHGWLKGLGGVQDITWPRYREWICGLDKYHLGIVDGLEAALGKPGEVMRIMWAPIRVRENTKGWIYLDGCSAAGATIKAHKSRKKADQEPFLVSMASLVK